MLKTRRELTAKIVTALICALALGADLLGRESLLSANPAVPLNRIIPAAPMATSADLLAYTPHFASLCLLLAYFIFTALMGWRALNLLLSEKGTPPHWLVQLSAGFLPGYLIVAAFNRLLGAVLSQTEAPYLSFSATVVIGVALLTTQPLPRLRSLSAEMLFTRLGEFSFLIFALSYALIDGIQVAPSSFLTYFQELITQGAVADTRMPWVARSYDELAFLSPLVLLLGGPQVPATVFFWFLQSIARLSALGLLYVLALRCQVRHGYALLIALFLWLGTTALYPIEYLPVFSARNPLYFTLHPGGLAAMLVPALVALSMVRRHPSLQSIDRITLFLFGAGIATLDLSVPLAALVFSVAALSTQKKFQLTPLALFLLMGCATLILFGGNGFAALIWKGRLLDESLWLPSPSGEPSPLPAHLRFFVMPLALCSFAWLSTRADVVLRKLMLASVILFFIGFVLDPLGTLVASSSLGMMLFSLSILFKHLQGRQLTALTVIVILCTFPVFFTSNRPGQWIENWRHSTTILWSRLTSRNNL